MSELTFIGLDVHARSVSAGILDGEHRRGAQLQRPGAGSTELVAWLRAQGESLSVAYEAGPTGFGLARACEAAGIPCLVAAPSKIAPAPGERVKTDRRDALRLAKPAAPGRAYGGARAEPRRGGRPRPGARPRGRPLRPDARPPPTLQAAPAPAGSSGRAPPGRRRTSAGWPGSASRHAACRSPTKRPWPPMSGRARPSRRPRRGDLRGGGQRALGGRRRSPCLPARRLHPDRLRPGHRDRRLAALRRPLDRRLPGPRAQRELLRRAPPPGGNHQDRQRVMRGACWSRPPGTSAGRPRAPAVSSRVAAKASRPQCACAPRRPDGACNDAGPLRRARQAPHGGRRGRGPRARRLVLEHRDRWTPEARTGTPRRARRAAPREEHARWDYEQPLPATLDSSRPLNKLALGRVS